LAGWLAGVTLNRGILNRLVVELAFPYNADLAIGRLAGTMQRDAGSLFAL
jgi:hypothetical protein